MGESLRITPSRQEVLAHQGRETHVALSTAVHVDLDSPIAIFQKLSRGRPSSFFLESVEGGELMGRYSFMGFAVQDRFEWSDGVAHLHREGAEIEFESSEPLEVLREYLAEYHVVAAENLPRFQGGAVGWIGYDTLDSLESVGAPAARGLDLPTLRLLLPEEVVIYDHLAHRLVFVVHVPLDGDRAADWDRGAARLQTWLAELADATLAAEPAWPLGAVDPAELEARVVSNQTPEAFKDSVREARKAIEAGEIFQVVVSQRFTLEESVDPFTLYRSLRALNPSPYMFYLHFEDCSIVGSSPEVLVRLEDGELLVRPIAGTRRRGVDAADDARLEADLLADAKELAEHRMLLDLGRNDVGRVAAAGSVRVADPLHIERYSHVMHIVSDVRGRLAPGKDAIDAFAACFPAGTVSGAPKVRACELIAEFEPERRSIYSGAVGYFDFSGNMDTAIAIRTLVVTPGAVHVQAGAGVVFDSDPEAEFEECRNKARGAIAAIGVARERMRVLGSRTSAAGGV